MSTKEASSSSINSSTIQSTHLTTIDDQIIAAQKRESLLYPLYSEISQFVHVPLPFYLLEILILVIQVIICCFWPLNSKVFPTEENKYPFIRIIQYGLDLGITKQEWGNTILYYVFMFIICLFIFGWHILVTFFYSRTRNFSKPVLYISHILQIIIVPCCLGWFPTFAGYAVYHLGLEATSDTTSGYTLAIAIISTIFSIILLIYGIFSYGLTCRNTVFTYTPFSAWDPLVVSAFFAFTSFSSFISPILSLFPPWVTFIIQILILLFMVYIQFKIIQFPFHFFYMHYVCSLVPGLYFSTQIVVAPLLFGAHLSQTTFLLIDLIVLVVEFFVMFTIIIIKRNKIVKQLSYSSFPEGTEKTEENKKKHLKDLNISESRILSYLRVGISHACDLFIDFSLPRFMIDNYKSLDVLIETTQVISFFTGEHILLGHCLTLLQQYNNLSILYQFLIFQMKKIYVLRQSSLPREAVSKIRKISKESSDAITSIRRFWVEITLPQAKIDFHQIVSILEYSNKYRTIYSDLSDKYSNNIEICKEYCNFLIEGAGDFIEAGKWHYRASMLEQGKHLNIDHSFVSLMNIFPNYLINEIVNIRGEFINKNDHKDNNSNIETSFLSSYLTSTSNGSEIGQKLEEITSGMIKNSRLRLSLQSALTKFEYPGLSTAKAVTLIQAIVTVLILIIFTITILAPTSGIFTIVGELLYFGNTYTSAEYATFVSSLLFSTHSLINKYDGINKITEITHYPINNITSTSNALNDAEEIISYHAKNGIYNLYSLMNSLIDQADSREQTFDQLLYQMFSINISKNLHIQPESEQKSIRGVIFESLNYYIRSSGYWKSGQKDTTDYLDSLYTGAYNMFHINDNLAQIKDGIAIDGNNYVEGIQETYFILLFVISILFFLVFSIFQFNVIYSLYKNCNHIIEILKEVKKDAVRLSLKRISKIKKLKRKGSNGNSAQLLVKRNFSYIFLPIMTIFSIIANTVMIILVFYIARLRIQDIGKLIVWFNLANTRFGSLYETVGLIGYLCSLTNEEDINTLNEFLLPTYETFRDSWDSMLNGNEEVERFMGVDEDLDEIHFTDTCSETYSELYMFYNCLSLDRKIIEAYILLKQLIQTIENEGPININLNDEEKYSNLILLCEFYLLNKLQSFQSYFEVYGDSQTNTFTSESQTFSIVFIFVSIVIFILHYLLYNSFNDFIEAIRILIRFLPPETIVENKSLMDLISQNKEETEKKLMSPAQTILSSLPYPAIILDSELSITSINYAAKEITGMTREQVIGCHINTFIPYLNPENNSPTDLYINIERIKSKEITSISFRMKIQELSQIDLIGITNQFGILNSYVIIIHSLKHEEDLAQEAIEAKKRTQEIIQNNLPKPLSFNLDQHEKDDSSYYVSDNSTIISIEILGILDSVFTLTPKQIFTEVLRKIYEFIEETITKYPALIIIKKTEQNILICSGLFDFSDNPKLQVEQSCDFCLDLIEATDDISEQIMVDISFNIGVAFGGPIAGNILSKSNPSFELLGNIQEVAYSFLDDGVTSVVKVNQGAANLLDKNIFVIEKGPEMKDKKFQQYYVKRKVKKNM